MMDNTIIRTSSSFYSVSSSDQPNNNPLAYCGAGESNEQALSAEQHRSDIHGVAASPQLEMSSVDEIKDNRLVHQRQRSSSAPPELLMYQQVALQLRGISDEFNQEYSHDERDAAAQRQAQRDRRRSLPEVQRPEPSLFHRMIQSFRRASNTPSRSHENSIYQVAEEDMNSEDELNQGT